MTKKLVLGTVQFGLNYGINNTLGQVSEANIKEILDVAFQENIKILDTAEAYGNAQERIGNYHRSSQHKFDVITKFHATSLIDKSFNIKQRVLDDIKVLAVKCLYGYMFHSFSDYKKYFTLFKVALLDLKSKNIINKIGVSVYTNEELLNVIEDENIKLIQLPFNLLDNHSLRSDAILKAKEKGVEIHTRSAFLQGLFFKPTNTIKGNVVDIVNYLKEIKNHSDIHQLDIATLALNYPIQKKYIDKVLIGVDSLAQLQQNLSSLKTNLNLNSIFNTLDSIKVKNKELLNPSTWKM